MTVYPVGASDESRIASEDRAMVDKRPADTTDLDAALLAYVRRHEEVTGTRIAEVQVRLADAEGRQRGRYTLALPTD